MRDILPVTSHSSYDVLNLGLLAHSFYEYWYMKGWFNAVVAQLVVITNGLILWIASFLIVVYVDWDRIVYCRGDACSGSVLRPEGFVYPPVWSFVGIASYSFFIASAGSVFYETARCVEKYYLLREVEEMVQQEVDVGFSTPFHSLLTHWRSLWGSYIEITPLQDIPSTTVRQRKKLNEMSWSDFLSACCTVLQPRFLMDNPDRRVDELHLVQAMMFVENHLIQLHQGNSLKSGPLAWCDTATIVDLMELMKNADYTFMKSEEVSRSSILLFVIFHTLLYPFILSYNFTKLVVKNVVNVRARPTAFMERDWNDHAKSYFRLYNEVPHIFEARMLKAKKVFLEMKQKLDAVSPSPLPRVVLRLCETIVVFVGIATFLNAVVLTSGSFMNQTLFWWLSIAMVLYSALERGDTNTREYRHTEDLHNLVHELHYEGDDWTISPNRVCDPLTDEFLPITAVILVQRLLSVIFMPVILLWLYFRSDDLKRLNEELRNGSTSTELGNVAIPSCFIDWRTFPQLKVRDGVPMRKLHTSIVQFASMYDSFRKIGYAPIEEVLAELRRAAVNGKEKRENSSLPMEESIQRLSTQIDAAPLPPRTAHEIESSCVGILDDAYSSKFFDPHLPKLGSYGTGRSEVAIEMEAKPS